MTRPTAKEEFDAASVVYAMNADARNRMIIAAKDGDGNIAHIRWRRWPDSDAPTREEHWPHWARLDTDELFEPIAWVPSIYTYDDIAKVYPV